MSLTILTERIKLLTLLKEYLLYPSDTLISIYEQAHLKNSWFTIQNVEYAVQNIAEELLDEGKLSEWANHYSVPAVKNSMIRNIGIVMAGNIPLVGFHDVLSVFMAGHKSVIKLSSKDSVIWNHIIEWLYQQNEESHLYFEVKEQLPGCDAYIATGSNNTSRYFESFFEKYPHIIRKNRSSVAVLSKEGDLNKLVHDVTSFFGLGCRNVSQIFLPEGYDTTQLLNAFENKTELMHHHGYRNNYDYHLAVYLLNRVPIQYNDYVILIENSEVHAPIASVHLQFYTEGDKEGLIQRLTDNENVQCISTDIPGVRSGKIVPLGKTQRPDLYQYPDGVDVMDFLMKL